MLDLNLGYQRFCCDKLPRSLFNLIDRKLCTICVFENVQRFSLITRLQMKLIQIMLSFREWLFCCLGLFLSCFVLINDKVVVIHVYNLDPVAI